jgi:molybdopterin/thiamine biosynthesis adenylyltransferase
MRITNLERVVILGLGGTGSILLPLVARYLRSQNYQGKLILIDGDEYSFSNVDRQLFAMKYIGENKAVYQFKALESQVPELTAQTHVITDYVGVADVDQIVTENTIVINCSDNKAARKIIEDRCLQLQNAVHICCGNELVTGQVQVNLRVDGVQITPSIYDRSPVFDSMAEDRSAMSCEEMAALPSGGQLICANATAAVLALNMLDQVLTNSIKSCGGKWLPCDMVQFNTTENGFIRLGEMPFRLEKLENATI